MPLISSISSKKFKISSVRIFHVTTLIHFEKSDIDCAPLITLKIRKNALHEKKQLNKIINEPFLEKYRYTKKYR